MSAQQPFLTNTATNEAAELRQEVAELRIEAELARSADAEKLAQIRTLLADEAFLDRFDCVAQLKALVTREG